MDEKSTWGRPAQARRGVACGGTESLLRAHRESHSSVHGRLAAARLAHFYDGPYGRGDGLAGVLALLIAHEGHHLSELRVLVLLVSGA